MEKTIKNITKLSSKMPKTLNEALNFNENEDFNDVDIEDNEVTTPSDVNQMEEPVIDSASEKAKKLIDDIRKMALRAMAELADTPQDPSYENLKRIWQLCDKAVSEKQEQQEVLQKNNI